ncbi:CHAT domain-containing protein [Oscillochloris sp. ZM17-4]|uniref:P-loop NTPase fold protein n=1 Tax=Oscillochloris sp. ZM17-4 TaxID=2866714 RepID=UPI001C73A7A9|nr:P-loop NTPase fold protein [Oscillochloris sp. ZM17-4]MBX0330190.1 CHAT domain-containing protein [Oscillochloris sp. ZM17-4]
MTNDVAGYSLFELSLTRSNSDSTYRAEARFTALGNAVSAVLANEAIVTLDVHVLLLLTDNNKGYGSALASMLFADPSMQKAWSQAGAATDAVGQGLRFVLRIDVRDSVLNTIRWELLCDPEDNSFIFTNEGVIGSRLLESADLAPVKLRVKEDLRALVIVASPSDLEQFKLAPIDTQVEVDRIRTALGVIYTKVISSDGSLRPSLVNIMNELREGYDIVYMLNHGTAHQGELVFWLEEDDGTSDRVLSSELAEIVRNTPQRPLLMVLAVPQSLGSNYPNTSTAAPWFIAAGVPAVLGIQGNVSLDTIVGFMPAFFRELQRDGQVDRAVAAARGNIRQSPDWWRIVLFLRLPGGRIWSNSTEKITGQGRTTLDPVSRVAKGTVQPSGSVVVAPGAATAYAEASGPSVTVTGATQDNTDKAPHTDNQLLQELLQAEAPELGVRHGAFNDEIAKEDHLDVASYIVAFADLIESRDTEPPLTIGVYGSWGMGKSFLLEGIAREIEQRWEKRERDRQEQVVRETTEQRAKPWSREQLKGQTREEAELLANTKSPLPPHMKRVHVISFNAWEYSANEVVWPGLVRAIMDRLERETSNQLYGLIGLRFWRSFIRQMRKERSRIILVVSLVLTVAGYFFFILRFDVRLVAGALAGLGVVGLAKLIGDTMAEPLSKWIATLFQEEEYGKQIGYMSQIRDDIQALEKRLAEQDSRILVTIDDLDRCEPDKAVAVLQAVKLLLNFNSFVVCIGIDTRIIARAIEKHYESLLGEVGASGYEYLDKIVQIPFQIPRPTPSIIREFFARQMAVARVVSAVGVSRGEATANAVGVALSDGEVDVSNIPHYSTEPESDELTVPVSVEAPVLPPVAFTAADLEAFQAVADALRPNPRYLKRLINVYWLVRTLAQYRDDQVILRNPAAVVCWLTISAQWPCVAYAMLWQFDNLLEKSADMSKPDFPSQSALPWLLNSACETIQREEQWRKLQYQLDDDISDLHRLIRHPSAQISWSNLDAIRRYTIHFNPAVEAELRFSEPAAEVTKPSQNGAVQNTEVKPSRIGDNQ